VIEHSAVIHDLVNSEIRGEWEEGARNEHKDPEDDERVQFYQELWKETCVAR